MQDRSIFVRVLEVEKLSSWYFVFKKIIASQYQIYHRLEVLKTLQYSENVNNEMFYKILYRKFEN